MRIPFPRHFLCLLAALLMPLSACAAGKSPGEMPSMPDSMRDEGGMQSLGSATSVPGAYGPKGSYKGKTVNTIKGDIDGGLVLPDGNDGLILIPGEKRRPQNKGYVDARELRLKARELGEQLIAGIRECSLKGAVALPTSFVDLNNFNETSGFGRVMAEQLFYEFNQRGFPVREYRIPGSIRMREKEGEFYLSRELSDMAASSPGSVVIVGTYYNDRQAIFVNARLVRPSDGRVLRTASLVLEANSLTRRMVGNTGKTFERGGMAIRDFKGAVSPAGVSGGGNPFDRGEDVH